MDYNIKFEYKGIGKQASGIRQKVLQAQKKGASAATGVSQAGGRETISALRTLNTSIQKLIASNKELTRAGKGAGAGSGAGAGRGGAAGIGRMGASIPILGAAIAMLGFTIQKVNQIGNAYIEKMSQQLTTVGIGGSGRRGQGIYTAAQMGAGMKAYGTATGKFVSGKQGPNQSALDMAAIYGLSPAETLQTAGQFKRAGGNYQQAAYMGAGIGIESELSTMMTGMAGILTDAVRDGVNTSDMSKDMARDLSAFVMATPGKSVEAAMNMVKSFSGVKKQVAAGKMGSYQALETTKASQQMLMEKLTGDKGTSYIKKLQEGGYINEKQSERMQSGLKEGSKFKDLLKIAPKAAFMLTRKTAAEAGAPQLLQRTMQNIKGKWGKGAEGFQRFTDFARSQDFSLSDANIKTAWDTEKITVPGDVALKGAKGIKGRAAKVRGGPEGMAAQKYLEMENLLLGAGKKFADTTLEMQTAMLNVARTAAPYAVKGITELGNAAKTMASTINDLFGSKKEKGILGISKTVLKIMDAVKATNSSSIYETK